MRRLNKIKSESLSTSKLCTSSQNIARTVSCSFYKHLVPGSVPGSGDTDVNNTVSVTEINGSHSLSIRTHS